MGRCARVAYFGSPEWSARVLRRLHASNHDVVLAVTTSDRRRGRGTEESPTPVKASALQLGIPVTHNLNDVLDVEADLGVLGAFGRIIPAPLVHSLEILNIHPSLLPRWRGAAPVERAILAGDSEVGVCIMRLDEKLDEGPIYASERVPVAPTATASDLYDELAGRGTDLLLELLDGPLPEPSPQEGEPTYADKLTSEDRHVRFADQTAEMVDRIVRIGDSWTTVSGSRLKILRGLPVDDEGENVTNLDVDVDTKDGVYRLLEVQPEGKRPMNAADWVRGLVQPPTFDE